LSPITIKTALRSAAFRLEKAGCDTPLLDAEVLLAHVLNTDRTWITLHRPDMLPEGHLEVYTELVEQREQRRPVAYITGVKEFYGLEFAVTPSVLIPRPETELLVETAIELLHSRPAAIVADVGTGSGCIAISLAKQLPGLTVLATDLSQEALDVAHQNAARHQANVSFFQGHLLTPIAPTIHIVVSNPPYVSTGFLQANSTMPEVSRYEPRLALDGGEQGLDLISALLAQAARKLHPDGAVLIEIGYDQGQRVLGLAKLYFPDAHIELKQDLASSDRLLVVRQPAF
jgi:release factor glutamine methyltransferase